MSESKGLAQDVTRSVLPSLASKYMVHNKEIVIIIRYLYAAHELAVDWRHMV